MRRKIRRPVSEGVREREGRLVTRERQCRRRLVDDFCYGGCVVRSFFVFASIIYYIAEMLCQQFSLLCRLFYLVAVNVALSLTSLVVM